jgi:hypothetical protein
MAEIINLPVTHTLDMRPERVLEMASQEEFDDVIVIGRTKDGCEYYGASMADGGLAIWRLDRAKLKLLRMGD